MRLRLLTVLGVVLLATLVAVPAAQSSTLGVNFTNLTGPGLGNPPFTLGWSFQTLGQIEVTALGLFDSGQNGLDVAHEIGLWDSAQTLLATVTVQAGTGSTLIDKFRWETIAPITLAANQTYFIGAYYPDGDGLIWPGTANGFTTGADISFVKNQFYDLSYPSLHFPGSSDSTSPSFFGPNLMYDPVPEPATLLLLGVGLASVARRAHRRR